MALALKQNKEFCYHLFQTSVYIYVIEKSATCPTWSQIKGPFFSIFPFFHFISLEKRENTMIILRNPQIAELIEAGCAFKSNVIISKNETKK